MKPGWQPRKWLEKKAKAGLRGFPLGTVAFYGPDDQRANKAAAAIFMAADSEPVELRRWFAENGDVRTDAAISAENARAWKGPPTLQERCGGHEVMERSNGTGGIVWMARRTRDKRLTWACFDAFLARHPLPTAKIVHRYATSANLST